MAPKKLPKPIEDIPADGVGDVVQSFITDSGVKQMDVSQQPDGTFTVTPEK
jgi:hypothetical protein